MIWNKLLSGRLWLTFIAGWTFAYCACVGIIESQAIIAIISSVFASYFARNDRVPSAIVAERRNQNTETK